ncbi:lipolytic protein G-D-S-L family (plasmid) [Deinococcus proteolyticus MRP]|uniref:Lipolytic protein G-D-S-L family n=1 Tax=Deinococcus proteolyticus (strain ATCC 35074 / DSM 20540 / JCM 6276 / NBRC 101906 / NCIMB 13154 / VKM Ac-1939 / CCM 2703 / MRP) TaxID=693977 RepID=F0RPM4_DEIPM|nr:MULTISPECIES: SGNH/GDSL hydrolase family protein [Deinococcus]ADY27330.1 lipolytic protein G-D-S-L family [Deinococcus proteolyticus MRP]MCY1704199.1 SGNH/GDSL hydrolase family protein [Deinococcus sp. SL84]
MTRPAHPSVRRGRFPLAGALLLALFSAACFAQDGDKPADTAPAAQVASAAATQAAPPSFPDDPSVPVTAAQLPAQPAQPRASQPTPRMAYVALGDSLTAGMQAAGLTAAGQYAAYPAVVARMTDVPFGIPATRRGCPAPMGGGLGEGACVRVSSDLRGSNFAVPGARVQDLYQKRGVGSTDDLTRRMYGLILGPQLTQVEAALKSRPDHLTLWIGANDAMIGVTQGDPALVTPPAEFEQHYRRVLEALKPAGARTLLLTVPDVTRLPLMSPGRVLFEKGVADANCQDSENRLPLTAFLLGRKLSCDVPEALTPAETAQIQATVQAYNDAILRLAAEFGHDVMAVQPLMDQLDFHTALDENSLEPFGPDMSADGVHLSSAAQRKLGYAVVQHVHQHWNIGLPEAARSELAAAGMTVAD